MGGQSYVCRVFQSLPQGVADAKQAITEAEYLGAPKGTALYFTVDYDAQSADMAAIVEYFSGVREGLAGQYLVGAYGSFSVLTALKSSASAPDKYWQTYAWSGGAVFPTNIYQFQNSVTIGGVSADEDTINTAPGAWPEIGNNTAEVENMTLQTLILYYGDADLPIAADLAQHFSCPVIQAAYATADSAQFRDDQIPSWGRNGSCGCDITSWSRPFCHDEGSS